MLARVARRVDGLPLALELVAGSSATVPIGHLLDLVASPLDLAPDARGLPDRHHSLRETLSWSLERLDPHTRVVLRRVAAFAGPFTATAARAVAGGEPAEVDRAVRVLARDNLLRVERTATSLSFRMLRTVRDLALEELAACGEEELCATRHRRWFAGVWRDAPLSDALVEHVGRTYDDHLEALTGALRVGDDPAAADLTTTLSRRWQLVETMAPGLHWTAAVLARPGITARQRARLRVARAGFRQAAEWGPAEQERLAADLDGDPDWGTLLALVSGITAYGEGDTAGARAAWPRPSSSPAPAHRTTSPRSSRPGPPSTRRRVAPTTPWRPPTRRWPWSAPPRRRSSWSPSCRRSRSRCSSAAARARPSTCSRRRRPTPVSGSACGPRAPSR